MAKAREIPSRSPASATVKTRRSSPARWVGEVVEIGLWWLSWMPDCAVDVHTRVHRNVRARENVRNLGPRAECRSLVGQVCQSINRTEWNWRGKTRGDPIAVWPEGSKTLSAMTGPSCQVGLGPSTSFVSPPRVTPDRYLGFIRCSRMGGRDWR